MVTSEHTAAVAFTGSEQGGLALWRLANERHSVIPVFAEMGTVNPVVVTPAGATRLAEVARGFVGSFTLGTGQFCTKPGLLLAPAGSGAAAAVGQALAAAAPRGWLLTQAIGRSAVAGVEQLVAAGAEVVARGEVAGSGMDRARHRPGPAGAGRSSAGSRLLEECFGPVALVAEYARPGRAAADIARAAAGRASPASVMTVGPDDPDTAWRGPLLRARGSGRPSTTGPTGVGWTWAQQHGGPWPATSGAVGDRPSALRLSIGSTGPVAYRDGARQALPAALRADNPWHLPAGSTAVLDGAAHGDRQRRCRMACSSPTSAGCSPARYATSCWPISAPRWSRSSGPVSGDETRALGPSVRPAGRVDVLRVASTAPSGASTLDLHGPGRPGGSCASWPRAPTSSVENTGAGALERLGLGYDAGQRRQPRRRLLLDHRLRESARAPTCRATTSSSRPSAGS